jgi:outer membrane cobalamin receptor
MAEACPFPPFCEFPGRFKTERWEAELLNHFHVGTWSTTSIGLEYRTEDGEAQGSSAFDATSHTKSAFLQQTFRFWDRLFMTGGFRVEDNSVYGTNWTERGSIAYLIREWGTRLRGSAGSGFRAPTFNELFFPGFSDPTLQPEDSFAWDIGIDQKLWNNRIRLGLTYFHQEIKNLIAVVPTATPPFAKGVNLGKTRMEGFEVAGDIDVLDNLTFSTNYTYTDTENLQTHRLLPAEPRHRVNLRAAWRPIQRLEVFGEGEWCERAVRAGRERSVPLEQRLLRAQRRRYVPTLQPLRVHPGRRSVDADSELDQRELLGGARLPGARHQRAGRAARVVLDLPGRARRRLDELAAGLGSS